MEDEEGYTALNLRPKRGGSGGPSPPGNQGSRQCPGWLQVALGAGNLILSLLLLAVCGSSGCKLCPTDWQLRGDKCCWVSRGGDMWSESRADCSVRGSQLLVIQDPKELEFLKDLTQGSNQFWVGLSVSSPEKAWTWVGGSPLNQTLFPVSGPAEGNRCGVVNRNRIRSDTCSSVLRWICQRDAVPL
ncbi:unnamed protein product [Caretta caretta]